ncbi:helix-turn-helix domain-containing protein [Streptomyces niveus]|uniref:helix-turn-helix domain-containing protein n=1 Tax=Streptomyces niveus TaxID=193462 RepID=UPI00363BD28F
MPRTQRCSLGRVSGITGARTATGRWAAVVCGVTERYFSMIENGKRSPSAGVLTRIAAELQVPVSALLGDEPPTGAPVTLTTAPDVAGALLGYGSTRAAGPPVGPVLLRERVEEAWRTWQKSDQRFTEIEEALPVLIADVEHSVRGLTARRATSRLGVTCSAWQLTSTGSCARTAAGPAV